MKIDRKLLCVFSTFPLEENPKGVAVVEPRINFSFIISREICKLNFFRVEGSAITNPSM